MLETVENKEDEKLLRRILGFDLLILYVKHVFTAAVAGSITQRKPTHWRSANEENKRGQEDLEESHRTSFTKVCDAMEKENIQGQRIVKLADLCGIDVSALGETKHPKPGYKTE